MDCGIPFCQQACPTHNLIPDWNDLVYRKRWRQAAEFLHSTNNFPEFTGRVCPAPCEESCTLELSRAPVTIKAIENAIIEHAWRCGWVTPELPRRKTGRHVAIIGSGPAGLACAQQLARVGHAVRVLEKNTRIGGLLRFGIPDFKMEKWLIDRRLKQMKAEGVEFHTGVHVGVDVPAKRLLEDFDAIVLACGAEQPRDLHVPGRDLEGIHFAMDYLVQQNLRIAGDPIEGPAISAKGKDVVIIGGGDTGSDCVGTANRQGARTVTQIQYHTMPPLDVDPLTVWPGPSGKVRTSDSHREGCQRLWGFNTIGFVGDDGHVTAVEMERIKWVRRPGGGWDKMPVANSRRLINCQLVLLAMGYAHPVHEGPIEELGLKKDPRGNVSTSSGFLTSVDKVFSCGDMRRGQSLVVWAIREGRLAARAVDACLMGETELPD
jgi:glutamate synthase (NADPH/NADH) small chain